MSGRMLDGDFKRVQRSFEGERRRRAGVVVSEVGLVQEAGAGVVHVDGNLDAEFPIEYARLRLVPFHTALYTASMVGYGWALEHRVNMVCPLVLQFLSEFGLPLFFSGFEFSF